MGFKRLYLLVIISLLSISAKAQSLTEKIDQAYKNFSEQPSLKNGWSSLTVIDNKTGKVLFEKNSHIGLPTASTLKIITSITALDILGPDFTFNTHLYYTGEIDSLGVLHGHIVIEGNGDPTLGSDRFGSTAGALVSEWASLIKSAGINHIEGSIIGDERLYNGNQAPGGYSWSDLGNYYGAGLSSLNWRENKIGVQFIPGKIGQEAKMLPANEQYDYLTFRNEVTTGKAGSGDNVYGFCAPYSSQIFLRGTYGIDLKKTIEISSPNPAIDVAYSLHNKLQNEGVVVSQEPQSSITVSDASIWEKNKNILSTVQSPPLKDIVHWFNQKSINLYGEALLIAIGRLSTGTTNFQESARLVQKYWNQKLNIPLGELKIYDGSGLSQQNRVTTKAMTQIIHYAKNKGWYNIFVKSLPNINNMTMKSGTIGGTLGYTGYQVSSAGDDVSFSLLVNNYSGYAGPMRQSMFRLLNTLK